MTEERKRILEMLSEGKITSEEAEKLLAALSKGEEVVSGNGSRTPRYLRVMVEPGPDSKNSDRVNIRVPLKLIRAGLKLASFIPKDAQCQVNDALQEKGIDVDFNKIKPEDIDEIIKQIDDLTVNVEGKETVRVFCE